MKRYCILVVLFFAVKVFAFTYNDGSFKFEPLKISNADRQNVKSSIEHENKVYDEKAHMLSKKLGGWNYHTDATSGVYHEIRQSLYYALDLLDIGDKEGETKAFKIISKVISIQDIDVKSPSFGVWPYYVEEPLATKKSPVDYNWADFNAVTLLEIYMVHYDRLSAPLKEEIKQSLINASKAIQKRNCGPSYTNISIMGSYVTFAVARLFKNEQLENYARRRFDNFYRYSLEKGGFTEYNSPTYSIVALEELNRMESHIIDPEMSKKVKQLTAMAWRVIATHYHEPSGQWTGPHSRSYSTLVGSVKTEFTRTIEKQFYSILKQATNNKVNLTPFFTHSYIHTHFQLPDSLLHYFTTPVYPRTQIDVFEKETPQVTGTSFLTGKYAISTASYSAMWNQRRPFTGYWGNYKEPRFIQLQLLNDGFDFSAATFHSAQYESKVAAVINFALNGGVKHINIDTMNMGRFKSKDLRIRFLFGKCKNFPADFKLPVNSTEPIKIMFDSLMFQFQLVKYDFNKETIHTELGHIGDNYFIDFVIYKGVEKSFNLSTLNAAYFALCFSMQSIDKPEIIMKNTLVKTDKSTINIQWNQLNVTTFTKPTKLPIKIS